VFYYIAANANSGKSQVRPITAPQGQWSFRVFGNMQQEKIQTMLFAKQAFPNPSSGLTILPIQVSSAEPIRIVIQDMMGRTVWSLDPKTYAPGNKQLFFNSEEWSPGLYQITAVQGINKSVQKLLVY
jgi:hypothetical protein